MPEKPSNDEALLWGGDSGPRRGPRPTLSRDRVVRAGIEIADAEGLDALSMQRVAARLGAATMALYRHVPGKQELVLLMLDAATGAPPEIDDRVDWRPALTTWARANWDVFARHPWALPIVMLPRTMGPNEVAWAEAALRALAPTGLEPLTALRVLMVVNGYVRGVASEAAGGPSVPGVDRIRAYDWTGRFPLFVGALESADHEAFEMPEPAEALAARFEFGLERVLDGIEPFVRAHGRQ
ncbi:TetR/AcrR family transcriptional regulator [Pseudonocardia acaciae]|uniref:TetR/AcrR family transcriptional regulator n=1 Tax=Pseudonocardia acaciae TaxID=551276 RepID=UPI000491F98B|nr:TetR/AcrR family transcriptional regulator C-terminal domain-containing protein [Pseudonocardia acaciae]